MASKSDDQPDEPVNQQISETSGQVVTPPESAPDETPAAAEVTSAAAPSTVEQAPRALPTMDTLYDFDYQVGTWSGLPNYGCPADGCQFASLDRRVVAEHYFDHHLQEG